MSSEAEKREREARGPHKESVDVYGIDEDGHQRQIIVSKDGKMLARTEMLIQSEYNSAPIARDANGRITQIVVTDGVRTKTIDIGRDANGRIDAINQTVV